MTTQEAFYLGRAYAMAKSNKDQEAVEMLQAFCPSVATALADMADEGGYDFDEGNIEVEAEELANDADLFASEESGEEGDADED